MMKASWTHFIYRIKISQCIGRGTNLVKCIWHLMQPMTARLSVSAIREMASTFFVQVGQAAGKPVQTPDSQNNLYKLNSELWDT